MPTYTIDLDAPPERRWDAVVKDKGPAVCCSSSLCGLGGSGDVLPGWLLPQVFATGCCHRWRNETRKAEREVEL